MSSSSVAYAVVFFVTSWLVSHTLLMPKPLPGIPHNPIARYMPWGDMIPLGIHYFRTGEVFRWLSLQNLHQRSPIVQLFLPSFSTVRPTLVLAELDEIDDIVKRRIGDIDRADLMHTWFGLVAPRATIGLKTNDRVFREQRRVWNVVLSPKFLEEVAAPCFLHASTQLTCLWAKKSKMTGPKRAFAAQDDIKLATLDGMWQTCIGSRLGLLATSIERLHESRPIKNERTDMVTFAKADLPKFFVVFGTLLTCLDWVMLGFSSRLYTWVFKYSGVLGRAMKEKDAILDYYIAASRKRVGMHPTVKMCALDEVIYKDLSLGGDLKNQGDELADAALRDELLELLITGHETTASSIAWALKYLTDSPEIQKRLRRSIRVALRHTSYSRLPSVTDLMAAPLQYLEAVIAETLRLSNTGPVSFRQTMVPCRLLGHDIPVGTPIILVTAGPSYNSAEGPPPSNTLSSKTSQIAFSHEQVRQAVSRSEDCNSPVYSLDKFVPERWLRDGKFDANAVHMLPFSAGSRGCFGKKIALLELKIMITIFILRFEFPRLPERLSGYQVQDGLTSRPQSCYVSPRAEQRYFPCD